MRYQTWVQRFTGGEAALIPGEAVSSVLGPYIDRQEPELGCIHVAVPDGLDATFYGDLLEAQLGVSAALSLVERPGSVDAALGDPARWLTEAGVLLADRLPT